MDALPSILKKFRERKELTQDKLAELTGISKRSLQYYEEGKHAPHDGKLAILMEVLGFNEDDIYAEKNALRTQERNKIAQTHEGETFLQKRRFKKNNTQDNYAATFIPLKAQAGYVSSYDQIDYLNTLEVYGMPPGVTPTGAIWRWFEVEGDSMIPTFNSGDTILASMVPTEDWIQLKNFYTYIIITETRIWIKRVVMKSTTEWVLISDNDELYPQVKLDVSEVKELWVMRRHVRSSAPPPKKFEITV